MRSRTEYNLFLFARFFFSAFTELLPKLCGFFVWLFWVVCLFLCFVGFLFIGLVFVCLIVFLQAMCDSNPKEQPGSTTPPKWSIRLVQPGLSH